MDKLRDSQIIIICKTIEEYKSVRRALGYPVCVEGIIADQLSRAIEKGDLLCVRVSWHKGRNMFTFRSWCELSWYKENAHRDFVGNIIYMCQDEAARRGVICLT